MLRAAKLPSMCTPRHCCSYTYTSYVVSGYRWRKWCWLPKRCFLVFGRLLPDSGRARQAKEAKGTPPSSLQPAVLIWSKQVSQCSKKNKLKKQVFSGKAVYKKQVLWKKASGKGAEIVCARDILSHTPITDSNEGIYLPMRSAFTAVAISMVVSLLFPNPSAWNNSTIDYIFFFSNFTTDILPGQCRCDLVHLVRRQTVSTTRVVKRCAGVCLLRS